MISMTKSEIGGLVHQLQPVVGAVGEQVLHPRPALADAVEDHLRAGAVGDVGGGEVDHQKPAVGIDRDVALAPDDLLAGVITARFGVGSLDRLAVDHAALTGSPRARPARDRSSAPRRGWSRNRNRRTNAAKPPVDGLPRAESASAASANRTPERAMIADGVDHLAEIDSSGAAATGRLGQERRQSAPTPHPSGPSDSAWSSSRSRPSGHGSAGVHIPSLNHDRENTAIPFSNGL